ncbi:DUF6298 domain-containing protein [Dysgonomonas sp. 511]|uniref:DUF6298 domain-containing protein n=1 Tax=Dysgonomonas sp. 511 TaxID=2302930 RepID=UPI001C87963C
MEKPIPPLEWKAGKLVYTPDSLGNRIPDFSYAGYMAGEMPIPQPAAIVSIPRTNGDATTSIQNAINYIGNLKPGENGFRGVIQFDPGTYKISGNINIPYSGIVLRGSGMNAGGTTLLATGEDRRTLIQISGKKDIIKGTPQEITDSYVPVNAMTMSVAAGHNLKKGDKIFIQRPSTQEWIKTLGTEHFGGGITALGWKAGEQDLFWDRTIVSAEGNQITIDAPITTTLDKKYGGGYIIPYTWNGRITNVGIENMTIASEYDTNNPKDEAHSWTAITMENMSDGWIRNIVFKHFAASAVAILETSKRITVENCKSLEPVSEIGGQRRYSFFTSGQQCLFQRIYAQQGYHDFAVGFCAPGPNAFVQCESDLPYSFSGPVDSWASGVLFDIVNVNGNVLSYKNRMQEAQGAGWNAANSVFWQCSASLVECFAPPTAQNWAFGTWAEFSGNGYWNESNNHINPRSLYYAQLQERLGEAYTDRADLLPVGREASSSPSIAVANELTKQAYNAPVTLSEWIDKVVEKQAIPLSENVDILATSINGIRVRKDSPLAITNGWITRNGQVQSGYKHNVPWWNGTVQPAYLNKTASPHLTRFVPSRMGTGLTDNIDSVAMWMTKNNIKVLDHNYGLWYDRRRDDHERIRRINGEVWAPFYEQPFARSGQGMAYDGLSKYDLTKYNTWYWMRLRQFAEKAGDEGLVLMHQNYFQHNIIEAGAHWTDSPWRPANNINNTGFPEPAPYAGDKRIFLAEQFYDVNHPVRRELHRAYIRQCLDNFKGTGSVIQLISEEYTGPLHFVEFWLDVIAEWEKETGEKQLIALSTTKDVQDAILADPIRSKIVDIIDIRYWFYRKDGSTYAPQGGQNLAPRQHARLVKPGGVDFTSVYCAVSEYRQKHPDKAVTFYASTYPQQAWAVFMAQGSLACLPKMSNSRFLEDAASMTIVPEMNTEGQYVLGNAATGYIVYSENEKISLNLTDKNRYDIYWINGKTGVVTKDKQSVKGGSLIDIQTKSSILWLVKK